MAEKTTSAAVIAAGALVALAVLGQGWMAAARAPAAATAADFGGLGSLVAVSIAGGPVYYGTLAEVRSDAVRIEGVYYVQQLVANNQQENRVVSRARTDWHGPAWMLIERDKIAFIESVSADSRLGQLIAQEKKQAESAASAPH